MTGRINNYNTNIDTGLKVVKVDAKRIFKIFYLPILMKCLVKVDNRIFVS